KGYGFVSFADARDYVTALREMNGKYIGNRPCKLRKSEWKEFNDTERINAFKQQQKKGKKKRKRPADASASSSSSSSSSSTSSVGGSVGLSGGRGTKRARDNSAV